MKEEPKTTDSDPDDSPVRDARSGETNAPSPHLDRRRFVAATSTTAMACGLAAGYGTLAVMAGRFLYPIEDDDTRWQFVTMAASVRVGQAYAYVSPSGAKVVIARQPTAADSKGTGQRTVSAKDSTGEDAAGEDAAGEDFIALSSVCPHLGCQVHWEPLNDRFFCPCHNGAFDPQGKATAGPPFKARQELIRFKTRVRHGMLFILAPVKSIV
jgi:Rieske Fe-S protein